MVGHTVLWLRNGVVVVPQVPALRSANATLPQPKPAIASPLGATARSAPNPEQVLDSVCGLAAITELPAGASRTNSPFAPPELTMS